MRGLGACGLIGVLCGSLLGLAYGAPAAVEPGAGDNTPSAQSLELLQAEPVTPAAPDASVTFEPTPVSEPFPVKTPGPTRTLLSSEIEDPAQLFSPYYFSAYIPTLDRTELDLGLLLSGSPGLGVALDWGAAEDLMLGTKLAVEGASNTLGFLGRYRLRPEVRTETKPAIAMLVSWRYTNQRTNGDVRTNIFRGNRFGLGATFSKDLGSLARALEAGRDWQDFWNHWHVHAEFLGEYQSGRVNATEDPMSRGELGARAALEYELEPRQLYLSAVYDSLPDRIDRENAYLGIRYYTRADFAVDALLGQIGSGIGLVASVAWIF